MTHGKLKTMQDLSSQAVSVPTSLTNCPHPPPPVLPPYHALYRFQEMQARRRHPIDVCRSLPTTKAKQGKSIEALWSDSIRPTLLHRQAWANDSPQAWASVKV